MPIIVEKIDYGCRLSSLEDNLTCHIVADSIVEACAIFKAVHGSEPYLITKLGNVYCYE